MPYKTQSLDTTEASERVQIEVLRRAGMGKRVEMMRRLSRTQKRMAWAALRKANPTLTKRELQVKAVGLWYGEENARRFEMGLKERGLWI